MTDTTAGGGKIQGGVQFWRSETDLVTINFDRGASATIALDPATHSIASYVLNPQAGFALDVRGHHSWRLPSAVVGGSGKIQVLSPTFSVLGAGSTTNSTDVSGHLYNWAASARLASPISGDFNDPNANRIQAGVETGLTGRKFSGDLDQSQGFLATSVGAPATSYSGYHFTAFLNINTLERIS